MYRSLFGAPLNKAAGLVIGVTIAVCGLAACSATPENQESSAEASQEVASETKMALVASQTWAKAASAKAEHPMTGVFMTLTNTTGGDVTVLSASSEAASMVELHETVADENGSTVMAEVEGGFVVPAGETRVLEPGADHIMLMGLTQDLIPGDAVALVLTLDNGQTVEVEAPIREFSGAKEEYSHEETQESAHTPGPDQSHSDGAHDDH